MRDKKNFDPMQWANPVSDDEQSKNTTAQEKSPNDNGFAAFDIELEKARAVCNELLRRGANIADDEGDYFRLIGAMVDLGEAGKDLCRQLCQQSTKYQERDFEYKWKWAMKDGQRSIHLATFYKMAQDAGVDLDAIARMAGSLPNEMKRRRGRPRKTDAEREEERKNKFEQVYQFLNSGYLFRYNTLSERIEVKPKGEDWRDFDDRELNGILTKLHSSNVMVSKENLATYINSGVFSTPYNPVLEYVKSLKPWNRRTDYIRQVFDHLILEDGTDGDFLFKCFKLYFVCLVACGADIDVVNQQILVLAGEKEGTGKTEFILRLLPLPLRRYLNSPTQLTTFKDKDEALATTNNLLFFLDEITLNRQTFNKLKNMVGGAGASMVNERAPYAHNTKVRKVHASFAATTNHVDFLPEDLGDRRFLVLPAVGSKKYDDMPIDKAFAQAYYLATHPRSFSTQISREMMARLKEINWKYVAEDICTAVLPTVLREPKQGEQAQAVIVGEIISWMNSRTGPNKDYTPQKVNAALKKMKIFPVKRSNKGNVYVVKRIMTDELKREGEQLANQIVKEETELELPF